MEHFPSRTNSSLATLCFVVACIGIGFGTSLIPIGLFVGQHVLIVAGVLIVLGGAYGIAALGIRNGKAWGFRLATAFSAVIVGIGLIAVRESLISLDKKSVIIWLCISLYFACLTCIAYRGVD